MVLGFGQAATPAIGMFFGEEDRTAMKDTLKATLRYGLALILPLAAVLLVFPSLFSKLLGVTDGSILAMSDMAIRFFAAGMPFYLINTVLMNFYQCTRRVGSATMICVLQSLVYTVLFAVVLIRPMSANGVWLAFLLGEVCTLLTIVILLAVKNKKKFLSLDAVMMLPEDFGGNRKDRLELSIGNSMDEVMAISSGIYIFGKSRDLNEKTLHPLSLCIEELAGNVVQHAFKAGEKRCLI